MTKLPLDILQIQTLLNLSDTTPHLKWNVCNFSTTHGSGINACEESGFYGLRSTFWQNIECWTSAVTGDLESCSNSVRPLVFCPLSKT